MYQYDLIQMDGTTNSQLNSMASRIRLGKVVPVISNVVSNDVFLDGHTTLVGKYKHGIGYQWIKNDDLSQITQYKNVIDEQDDRWDLACNYIDFIKAYMMEKAKSNGVSRDVLDEIREEFSEILPVKIAERFDRFNSDNALENVFLLLAEFPLPIYLTTCYHDFIEAALREVGKNPRTEICRWHSGLESHPSVFDGNYDPNPNEPLVYHLFGSDQYPDSLVLTEDHHLEFLVAISEFRSDTDKDRIPVRIRRAMNESLVLLGFSLHCADFKSLFWGLIKPRARSPRSISVQLLPDENEACYLEKYLRKVEFEVVWEDTLTYLRNLYDVLQT